MIWFILIPLLFAAIAYRVSQDSYIQYTMKDCLGHSLIWAFIALFPALMIAALIGNILPAEERFQGQLEIVALADATHVDGRFYIFGGTIESEPVYRFYYESDGGYRMGWKPVNDSLIVESDTETPRYEKIEDVRDFDWWGMNSTRDTRYIFYVPPGTVTNDFSLDLEG